jgi:hypothetical protein
MCDCVTKLYATEVFLFYILFTCHPPFPTIGNDDERKLVLNVHAALGCKFSFFLLNTQIYCFEGCFITCPVSLL